MNKRRLRVSKVLIAAGGSGGHLFPAQQLAEMLCKRGKCKLLFAGYKLSQTPFFAKEKIPFIEITASPLMDFRFPFAFTKGFWASLKAIRSFDPDVVVGFGSYHVFPVLSAAAILRKKIVLFEANCALGKVNRFFAPFAQSIAVQFSVGKGVLVPLFPWITKEEQWDQQAARRHYQLDPDTFTVLVFGGSQGAHFLNEKVPTALSCIPGKKQVIHFTGKNRDVAVKETYQRLKIAAHVAPFEPNMAIAYAAADCAICRSGAGTITELIRHKIAALLIPFPFASEDHQRKNGEYLTRHGAAHLVLEEEAGQDRLVREIEKLIADRSAKRLSLQKMDLQNINRVDFADLVRQVGESV